MYYETEVQTPTSAAFGVLGSALSGAMEARKNEDLPKLRERMNTLYEAMAALEAAANPNAVFGRGPADEYTMAEAGGPTMNRRGQWRT
jgi:hypothetical protein